MGRTHDFLATPAPENVEDLFGAGVDLVAQRAGDGPRVVPLTDPPDGWEVLGDGLEDQEIRPDMMWQVSGNVAAGGIVYFRLPDASQPVGAAIPQWPQIVGPDQEVDADEFQRLAKANCYW